MKINISFPSVMKLIFMTDIEVDEPVSLTKTKQKIFDVFWKTMENYSQHGKHGSPDQVILKDEKGIEILSDLDLECSISESPHFQIVFSGHV